MPPSYGLPFSLLSVPANFHISKWYDICESCALFAFPCLPFRFGARAKDRARYVSYPTGLETSTLRMIILCHAIMPCSALLCLSSSDSSKSSNHQIIFSIVAIFSISSIFSIFAIFSIFSLPATRHSSYHPGKLWEKIAFSPL